MAKDIHEAIHEVMKQVEYVQKQRSVEGGVQYKFAGEAALIAALRPAMVAADIYMHVAETLDVFRETYQTSRGSTMLRTAVRLKVRFTHAPSGTSIDTEAWGEGSDVGDKSTPKAMTGAYKYALRETFCIETGDDPDEQSSQKQTRAPAASTARSEPANGSPRLESQKAEVTAAAKSEFTRRAVAAGLSTYSAMCVAFKQVAAEGALEDYVKRRAEHSKTHEANIWRKMVEELPAKVEAAKAEQPALAE